MTLHIDTPLRITIALLMLLISPDTLYSPFFAAAATILIAAAIIRHIRYAIAFFSIFSLPLRLRHAILLRPCRCIMIYDTPLR